MVTQQQIEQVAKYVVGSVYRDLIDWISVQPGTKGGVQGQFIDRHPGGDRHFAHLIKDGHIEIELLNPDGDYSAVSPTL